MRKVLSFVLVLSLILGSFSFAFGVGATSDFPDVKDTSAEGPVAVLSALGVINGYPDGTFKPEKVVTRAEMAKLIVVALGMDSYVEGMNSTFPDTNGHWANKYIAWCNSYGIVIGYNDGTFKPNNTVTLQQATTMIVRALGYQDQYLTGTWPTSHVSMAMSLDILEDIIATADGATRGDVARMLYNALDATLINYDTNGNLTQTTDTMLKRLGAYEFEQTVKREYGVDAAININEYVGSYAKFWAIDADKDKETGIVDERASYKEGSDTFYGVDTKYECIVAIEETLSTFVTGTLDVTDKELTVGSKVYKFRDKADEDLIGVDASDVNILELAADKLFYNGYDYSDMKTSSATRTNFIESLGEIEDEDLNITLAAKVSGNYITKVYSIMIWYADAEVQWDDDYAAEMSDDQSIDDLEFILDDDDEIDMKEFYLLGADTLDAVAEDDVVTVYAFEGDISRVEVGTEALDSKVSSVNKDKDKFTIDGTAYNLSPYFVTLNSSALPLVGDEGVFRLNYNGELAFVDTTGTTGNYAVVLQPANDDDSYGSGSTWELYLLTKDDERSVFKFNKEETGKTFGASANTNTAATSQYVTSELSKVNMAGALVKIKTNSSGKLTSATKPGNVTSVSNKKMSTKGIFDGREVLSDAVIFVVPSFDRDSTYFKGTVTGTDYSKTYFKDSADCYTASVKDIDTDASIEAIYSVNSNGKIDAMVVTEDAVGGGDTMGFITGYEMRENSDDDIVYYVNLLVDGKAVSYMTDISEGETAGDAIVDADVYDLMVFEFTGDVIDDVYVAVITDETAPLSDFKDSTNPLTNAIAYTSTLTNLFTDTTNYPSAQSVDVFKINAKSGNNVDVGDGSTVDYQYIGDAKYYRITVSKGKIDKMTTGSSSQVRAGAYAILLQLDEDSEAWDAVVYMTQSDYESLSTANKPW